MKTLRTKLGVTSASIALGGSLLLSGCSTDAAPGLDVATTEQTQHEPVAEFPQNSCPPSQELGPDAAKLEAEQCAQAIHRGRIALVGYGISMPVLSRLATDTERLMAGETNGLSHIDVVPMQADVNQTISFDEINGKCIDPNEITSSPAYVANDVNRGLDKYDVVIGASPLPSCGGDGNIEGIRGTYSTADGGRFITIYDADKKLPHPNKVTKIGTGASMIQSQLFDADVAVHELLHAYGLGHSNSITGDTLDNVAYNFHYKAPYNVDLQKLVKVSQLIEYGDELNIMGTSQPDITDKEQFGANQLSNTQLAWLNQPEVMLGKEPNEFINLTDKKLSVELHKIYTVDLPEPITAKDFVKGDQTFLSTHGTDVSYNKIAIQDPSLSGNNPGGILTVYLISDETHDQINLGTIFGDSGDAWHMSYGNKTVTVNFGDTKTTLEVKTT